MGKGCVIQGHWHMLSVFATVSTEIRLQLGPHSKLFCFPWATPDSTERMILSQKGDPFQSLRVGSCLTLRNELSKETLTKQKTLLGRGTRAERGG